MTSPLEEQAMLVDPLASLKNSLYLSLGMSGLPEFKGGPHEDIEKFLNEFGRAVTALPNEQKCLALKRALVGDAAIFLKKYLKQELLRGDWKYIKAELRKRFSRIDPNLLYRTQLKKMSFDPQESTLLGYVDRYASLYKKIHSAAKDNELIQDLSLNLGENIVLKLNHLSADWKDINCFEKFRCLISRLERDIMSLENDLSSRSTKDLTASVNELVTSALQSPINEIRGILNNLKDKANETVDTEKVAAIKHADHPNYRQFNNTGKRRDREWDQDRHQRANNYQGEKPSFKRGRDLKKTYEEKFGRVNGPCFYCGGQHFRRHCPLDMPDLKD